MGGIPAALAGGMASHEDILERLAAAFLRPGADRRACRLMNRPQSDGGALTLEKLAEELGIEPSERTTRLQRARDLAARAFDEAVRRGMTLLTTNDERYPARLVQIPDPPIALWTVGPVSLDEPAVAIVGSRTATPAGLIVARQLSEDLAGRGYTVVSGLAAGVDGAAHQATLAAGGATVAVLGCGVDVVYPERHRALAGVIAAEGRLVSEFPPGTGPRPEHFPQRNRVISGLVQAVVVVEAAKKSGSLITAKEAMEQGRDVMAVPGSVAGGRYRGCHALIRDGARLVESVDDVLEELEGIRPVLERDDGVKPLFVSYLEPVMARGTAYTVDDLAERTGRPAPELLADLADLEIEGRVARTAGGCFVRP